MSVGKHSSVRSTPMLEENARNTTVQQQSRRKAEEMQPTGAELGRALAARC